MSLKAGRVGVNPADVDPVSGNINPSSVDSYTKSQADDKFLSKSDAASTYESKSDASTAHNQLQPKTLIVPISMLQGSQLVPKTTVESVFATMDGAMTNEKLTDMVSLVSGELTDIISGASLESGSNYLYRVGKMVFLALRMLDITCAANAAIAILPVGFRPIQNLYGVGHITGSPLAVQINQAGEIKPSLALENRSCSLVMSWITL